tara:strand:- start:4989 stop:6140 length:1152 start_codon:yes stop_codon:yes gene_type:complete
MFAAKDIKTQTKNDYHKRNIYFFDNIIEEAICCEQKIKENCFNDYILKIDSIYDLTDKILNTECLSFINVLKNNRENYSSCDFFKNTITYCQSHEKEKQTVFHELAHYFDYLFSVPTLPAHGIGFLSALEYLLNKYDVISKNIFQHLLTNFNKKGYIKSKLPYVKNYYTVTEMTETDFDQEFENLVVDNACVESLKVREQIKFPTHPNVRKNVFEKETHYINLIKIFDDNQNTIRCIKVIVKKLGYELKTKKTKNYQVIISPKVKLSKSYSNTLSHETRKDFGEFSGIAIFMNDKNLDPELVVSLLKQNDIFKEQFMSEYDYHIYIRSDQTIFIGFCNYNFDNNFILKKIKDIKNLFKNKRLSYYHTKSLNDLNNSLENKTTL